MPERDASLWVAAIAGRGLGLLILVVLTWAVLAQGLALQDGAVLAFIHGIDLVFHEAGHVIFGFFGEFLAVLGGSLTQVLMPVIATVAFLRTRQWASGAATLFWTGQSLTVALPSRATRPLAVGRDHRPRHLRARRADDGRVVAPARAGHPAVLERA